MNRAAMIMAAVSGLLGGYQKSRSDARDHDMDERKLALQAAALDQKSPSSGVANIEYLQRMFPAKDDGTGGITRSEALRLLSPAGFAPPQIPGEIAAFQADPTGVTNFNTMKANAGKPAPLDLGDDSDSGDERDSPSVPRPAVRAQPPATPAGPPPAAAPAAPPAGPSKSGAVRKRFNPATGQLEAIDRVNFNEI